MIGVTECERDLYVFVSPDGTWYKQVNAAPSKADCVLGLMKNIFAHGQIK